MLVQNGKTRPHQMQDQDRRPGIVSGSGEKGTFLCLEAIDQGGAGWEEEEVEYGKKLPREDGMPN